MSGAASVNIKEVDISTRVASFEGVFGGVVIQAKKGATDRPQFVSSDTALLNTFTPNGRVEVGFDLAYFSALAFLERANKLWVQRAVNTAYYGGLTIVQDGAAGNSQALPGGTNLANPGAFVFGADDCLLIHAANEGAWANNIGVRITTIDEDPDLLEPNSFLIEVFETTNQATPVESFLVTRVLGQKDGAGRNMFVEDVLGASAYIRARSNPLIDGTVLPKGVVSAVAASATEQGVTFTADNAGVIGNSISLVFDGVADIDTVVNAWNTANPTNTVGFTGGAGTDVLTSVTVALAGGTDAINDQIVFMGDGNDGLAVGDAQMITAANKFNNKAQTNVTLLMDGGYATPAYQIALDTICQQRQDCVAILSVPFAKEDSSSYLNEVVDYRKTELNLNSSYSALYTPHLQISDRFNDREIFVSPDGYVAGSISFSSQQFEIWFPPAGFKRGILNVLDTKRRYEDGELDVLYDNGINPIRFFPGRGIVVWGQKTLQARSSALDRLNVRLLLIVIEPAIKELLENFLFDLNEAGVRSIIEGQIEDYLETIRAKKGITDYDVVADDTNNSAADIDANRLNVDIFIKPTRSIEEIPVRVVITPTGISFSDAAGAI
jgi:phage tail sheath protein FI